MEYIANKLFFEHPNSVGETYFQHFINAVYIGNKMLAFAIAAYIHALVPGIDLFKAAGTTSCAELDKLSNLLKQRRNRQQEQDESDNEKEHDE